MLHETFLDQNRPLPANVAAVWPVSPLMAPLPITEVSEPLRIEPQKPTPAAPDVPGGVGVMIVLCYGALVSALAAASVASRESAFAIAIAALFLVAFFTVPRLFFGIEPARGRRQSLDGFLHEGMETMTGHSSGGAALVQMLIVPVMLTLGIAAMGIAAAVYM
jgi:hypothetical protein